MSESTAITIGSFDGVHRGHAALIHAARRAVGPGGRVVAMAFDPHPLCVLRPAAAPSRLSLFEQRRAWIGMEGGTDVVRIEPTPELLGLTPRQFLERVVRQHDAKFIVAGRDFGFGKGRGGDVRTLRDLENEYGYRTIVLDEVRLTLMDQSVVRAASSTIRWLVERGRMRDAAILLGRPYELRATVVSGEKRGRDLGAPTANLDCGDLLLPADGIYAGWASTHSGEFPAAISIGTKPTFGKRARACEAHLIGFRGPLDDYGWPVTLRIHHWLRDQLKYDDVDGLKQQIARDIDRTASLMRRGAGDPGSSNRDDVQGPRRVAAARSGLGASLLLS